MQTAMTKAYIVLENGKVYEGSAFGAEAESAGELVFTTAMTGYLETLSDPCYFGQIVCHSFPLIGNCGIIEEDLESETPALKGYIVGEWCQVPSNFRGESTLDAFLKEKNIPGVCGVDTRSLVKTIRENGCMNAKIVYGTDKLDEITAELKGYKIVDAVKSTSAAETVRRTGSGGWHAVLWDFGAKNGVDKQLAKLGCDIASVSYCTTAEQLLAMKPDGVVLSAGPGDPSDNAAVIEEIRKLKGSGIPIFGYGLGHQLLALACGAETEKLHHGHRGANQPVHDNKTGMTHITGQNHGYAVLSRSLPAGAVERYENGNDGSCEGIDYLDFPAFSVQFTPGDEVVRRFVEMMESR